MAHNFEYMGWQYWVPIVALEHSNCSDPQMTPRQCCLFLAVSGHFFFSEKCRNFCGQILPSLPHLHLGVAPPEAPHPTYGAHFSVRHDFLQQAAQKRRKRGGSARQQNSIRQWDCTRRKKEGALGTVNSQFFKKFTFCNTLLTVFRIESWLYQVRPPSSVFLLPPAFCLCSLCV